MSIVYLVALAAVALVFLGVMYEAVVSVSRKPQWHSQKQTLSLVNTVDRREQQLPFVGQDRRHAADEAATQNPDLRQAS